MYPLILRIISDPPPDMGPVMSGYLLLILMGGTYLAIGTLASALTSNATLAFLTTFFAILIGLFAGLAGQFVPDVFKPVVYEFSVSARAADFARGVIDLSHVVFFAGFSAVCVAGAAVAVELRRWS